MPACSKLNPVGLAHKHTHLQGKGVHQQLQRIEACCCIGSPQAPEQDGAVQAVQQAIHSRGGFVLVQPCQDLAQPRCQGRAAGQDG